MSASSAFNKVELCNKLMSDDIVVCTGIKLHYLRFQKCTGFGNYEGGVFGGGGGGGVGHTYSQRQCLADSPSHSDVMHLYASSHLCSVITDNGVFLSFVTLSLSGTVAEGAPIIPISAQLKYNIEVICEYISKKIPIPTRDFISPPRLIVIRSFDVNKPGAEVDDLKGGVAGGSILRGVLKVRMLCVGVDMVVFYLLLLCCFFVLLFCCCCFFVFFRLVKRLRFGQVL